MSFKINVEIRDEGVKTLLTNIRTRLDNLRPAMVIIGEIVQASVIRNFEEGGRPAKWDPSGRARATGGKTLVDKGIGGGLEGSISYRASTNSVAIGTNKKYAAIHQFGGKTAAHIIRPKNKAALFWPGAGHPLKSVNHPGSRIPARPYLMVQDKDWAEIRAALARYMTGGKP